MVASSVVSGSSRTSARPKPKATKPKPQPNVDAKTHKTGGRKGTLACTWCRRSWETPHPILKKEGNLPRCKGYGPRCDICKHAFAWACKGTDEKARGAEIQASDEAHEEWMRTCVKPYEDFKNGVDDPKASFPESRDGPLTTIEQNDGVDILRTEVLGNFWPVHVFKRFFKEDPPQAAITTEEGDNGAEVEGILRDPSQDPPHLPIGVIQLAKRRTKGAKRKRELDRSDQHVREGQGRDAWNFAKRPLEASAEAAELAGEGDAPTTKYIKLTAAPKPTGNLSDDDDDFSLAFGIKCASIRAPAPTKKLPKAKAQTKKPNGDRVSDTEESDVDGSRSRTTASTKLKQKKPQEVEGHEDFDGSQNWSSKSTESDAGAPIR